MNASSRGLLVIKTQKVRYIHRQRVNLKDAIRLRRCQASFHGVRYSRLSSLLASASPTISSFSTFQRIFRPVSMEIKPK